MHHSASLPFLSCRLSTTALPQALTLTAPISTWDEAIPLGNGLLGGLLWGEGRTLKLSLDRGVYDALREIDASAADGPTRHYLHRLLRDFRRAGVDRDDATRARKYDAWLPRISSLGFVWQVLPEGVPDNDGFGVYYPSDGATLDVLVRWAR